MVDEYLGKIRDKKEVDKGKDGIVWNRIYNFERKREVEVKE